MDHHDRARIRMLAIDHRRMNHMLWRNHPLFALRSVMARRFTVDGFWLPMARSLGLCMGYGASTLEGTTHTGSPPASSTVTPVLDGPPV